MTVLKLRHLFMLSCIICTMYHNRCGIYIMQYWHRWTTTHLSCIHMMIITHYRWMGNTDGAVRGVRLKTVLLLDVEWFIPRLCLCTVCMSVCVCVCVCVCVRCLQTDQFFSEEWKAGTSSVPVLIFLLKCLIEVVGVYIIEVSSLNHSLHFSSSLPLKH